MHIAGGLRCQASKSAELLPVATSVSTTITMRTYYLDDLPGNPCLAHNSGNPASVDILENLKVLYWNIPIDPVGAWQTSIDQVATSREYKNRDIVDFTAETLGEEKMKMFFDEYVPEVGG